MKFQNKDRNLLKIIKEISEASTIDMRLLSEDWVIELRKGAEYRYIFGYNFELNSSTAQMIAQDKCAAYVVLEGKGVPAIEHQLFMNPSIHKYFEGKGNWRALMDYFNQYHQKIVCKPSTGTGGGEVYRIDNLIDLEIKVHQLFAKHRSIALSPFYEIEKEYRVMVLEGEVMLVYTKIIPHVEGDGESSIYELMRQKFDDVQLQNIHKKAAILQLQRVLELGEIFHFHWKHNLGLTAQPKIIREPDLLEKLGALAIQACQAINIRFASVDIVQVGRELKVLEINSGVMAETFSRSSEEAYEIIKGIYAKAIDLMFNK